MAIKQRAVFFDKDGTLIPDIPYSVDQRRITLFPDAGKSLLRLSRAGYILIIVSNQSGVALGYFSEHEVDGVFERLRGLLRNEEVELDGYYYCPHHPEGSDPVYSITCWCRKPLPGLLFKAALKQGVSLKSSWMVGDILDDIEAGDRAGCRTVLVDTGGETEWRNGVHRSPTYRVSSLTEAVDRILAADEYNKSRARDEWSDSFKHQRI